MQSTRDTKPLDRVDIAVIALIAAYVALYMWQVNILPTERYPNWDAYWVDVRTMAGLASLRDALLRGELPLINPFDGLASNLGGNHHSPIGILNFLVLLLDPVRVMIVAQYAILLAGAAFSYAYLRIFSRNVLLCLLGALMYIGVPIVTSRYYFDQTLFGFVLISVFLFHTHKFIIAPTSLLRATHATALAIFGFAAIGMGDIFILITLPCTVFIYAAVLALGLMRKSWIAGIGLALGASLLTLLSGSYYIALLLENLVQNAHEARVFVENGLLPAAAPHVRNFFEYMFWNFAAGSLVLPMHGSGAFLYAPIGFYLILAAGLYAVFRDRQFTEMRAVSACALLAAGLFPFLFMWFFYSDTLYALLPAISTAATGRIRHLWNVWPFLLTLATFVILTGRETDKQKIPNWIVGIGVIAAAIEYWLFFFHPSESSLYNISHVDTTGFPSPNRIAIAFLGDPWFLLPLVNLLIVVLMGITLTPRLSRPTRYLSAAWGIPVVILASLIFVIVQNELRVYQGDWQLATSNRIRYRSYIERKACIDRAVNRSDPNYRTLVASAPVFGPFGRNWKLIAETELSTADRERTLYSWREIIEPYVPMTLGLFTGEFDRTVKYPPTTDELVAHAHVLGLLGVRWVVSADQQIANAAFSPVVACSSPDGPMSKFWHEKEGGTLYVYAVRDPLPIAWVADHVEVSDKSAIVHRIFVNRETPWTTRTALVDRLPADFSVTDGAGEGSSTAAVQETTNLTLRISARAAGNRVLVVDYAHRPGWSATVDGRRAPILDAFGGMMAVALTSGDHDVKLVYRSPALFWGSLFSLLTLLAPFAAYGLISAYRRFYPGTVRAASNEK